MPHIILLGTLDSKLEEFLYLYDQLTQCPFQSKVKVTLVDCGRSPVKHKRIDITQADLVSRYGPNGHEQSLMDMARGDVIKFMTECATACVKDLLSGDESVHGVISAGGSGGSSLAAAVMRKAIPIGMPKLIVSTVASGDTGLFVGETDITMMYSVVDIAGSNQLLRNILSNAAGAIVGMASVYEQKQISMRDNQAPHKTRIGMTMFGVTTPCVDKAREHLESNYPVEVFVFHATGHGGRAMERLVEEGRLDAVLDITTTEICDFLMGGNMSAGPTRLDAALKAGIPNVISLGATDMVNFGPIVTVPEKYRHRLLFEHNPTVTLMRTTPEECVEIGKYIADKIKSLARDMSMVQIRIPNGGVSIIATPGAVFANETAHTALVDTIKKELDDTGVKIVNDERAINEEEFALGIAEQTMQLLREVHGSTSSVP